MKSIHLHIGDRVKHQSLGDGVVIAVNDDYCTARFGEKEANFRIPDAFVRGYLTSPDARIGSGEGEERAVEEIVSDGEKMPEEKKVNGSALAVFIFMGVFALTPFLVYYIWHLGHNGDISDVVGIICFVLGFIIYIPFAIKLSRVSGSGTTRVNNPKTGVDLGTELMAGVLGSEIINRELKRSRQEAEKRRYDSLYWQESIRDKNPRHDFDYDHMDD